jgi:hypothetical protein
MVALQRIRTPDLMEKEWPGVLECWSAGVLEAPTLQHSNTPFGATLIPRTVTGTAPGRS